ncbi:MAG: nodulation protein NfeD [Bacteroidetes bacterium]|nr:nodulation protein NfeD [Bacteroidota bacterium]
MKSNKVLVVVGVILPFLISSFLSTSTCFGSNQDLQDDDTLKIYSFEMKQMVDKGLWRLTQRAQEEAEDWGADLILIHMNTYGGLVDMADSIRTKILNSEIPYWIFIDNNAASAGALISIACDSIFMRPGGNMGAATVVNQTGEQQPDKYQSYMRSTMRSTAEAKGKDTVLINGEVKYTWRRNPAIAEAMVDPTLFVEFVSDTGKVLTFTPAEAMNWGFCEGQANSMEEVIKNAGINKYELKSYKQTTLDRLINILLSPALQGILILVIVGGIYFELQTPGVGFPIIASVLAGLLYFAPLYLEGLAANWEVLIFVAGVILVLVEIFAIPGFGVAGVSGITLMVSGLALSMVGNVVFDFSNVSFIELFRAFAFVIFFFFLSLILSIWAGQKLLTSMPFKFLSLQADQKKGEGYVSVPLSIKELVGKTGEAYSILRPSGKVMIEGEVYDAVAESSWIEKGSNIKVIRQETTQLYVRKV